MVTIKYTSLCVLVMASAIGTGVVSVARHREAKTGADCGTEALHRHAKSGQVDRSAGGSGTRNAVGGCGRSLALRTDRGRSNEGGRALYDSARVLRWIQGSSALASDGREHSRVKRWVRSRHWRQIRHGRNARHSHRRLRVHAAADASLWFVQGRNRYLGLWHRAFPNQLDQ